MKETKFETAWQIDHTRYWVMFPFAHFAYKYPKVRVKAIFCARPGCTRIVRKIGDEKLAILMYEDEPICVHHASELIVEKAPVTRTYFKWMEEGDPRWWSHIFCVCPGCKSQGPPSKSMSFG